MVNKILITGGAGFVGSHLADELLARGYEVRLLDNLTRQVHPSGEKPGYLHPDAELVIGDVRDPDIVRHALDGVDAVFHFAAAVGVVQSMYQIAHYTDVNCVGTAVLLEALSHCNLKRLVVASSMSIYGEGVYLTGDGACVQPLERSTAQLAARNWDLMDSDSRPLQPIATPESKTPAAPSIYSSF